MATATLIRDDIHGYGPEKSRLYKLDPPLQDPQTGETYEHVFVSIYPGAPPYVLPKAVVLAANADGSPASRSMKGLAEYCHGWDPTDQAVLGLAGFYQIVAE